MDESSSFMFGNNSAVAAMNALQVAASAGMMDGKNPQSMPFYPYSPFHPTSTMSSSLRPMHTALQNRTPFGINDILNRSMASSNSASPDSNDSPLMSMASNMDTGGRFTSSMGQDSAVAQAAAMYFGAGGMGMTGNSSVRFGKPLAELPGRAPIYWPGIISDDWREKISMQSSPSAIVMEKYGRKKHTRPTFSGQQIFALEKTFEQSKYLAGPERAKLAYSLAMTESQVKVWFQNRRTKWRKQHAAEMASAKKRQDGEVNEKIKERERDAQQEDSDSPNSYPLSKSMKESFKNEIESREGHNYDNYSDSQSSSGSLSSARNKMENENTESGEEAGNMPLPPDRPSSGASAENEDSDTEKNHRNFKNLIYGVCKNQNERFGSTAPGNYTSQFSVCSGNILSEDGLSHFNNGIISVSKNSGVAYGNQNHRNVNSIPNLYGTSSPVVGPISMDSLFGGCSTMFQSDLIGDSDIQKY